MRRGRRTPASESQGKGSAARCGALVMAALVMWLGVSRENLVKPEKKTNVDKVMT